MPPTPACGPEPRFGFKDVKDILLRAYRDMGKHRTSLLAAGLAFYALFAIFPGLGAVTWLFGLFANPATIHGQLENLKGVVPAEAWQIIDRQIGELTKNSTSISVAGIVALLVALYSARAAASSMMEALNAVYEIPETRGFLAANGIAVLFTLVAIFLLLAAAGVMIVLPILFGFVGLSSIFSQIIHYAKWPALAVLMALALALMYRFGPNRAGARWKWVTWGSAMATVLWLIASFGFSWYVSAFNSYDKVYGSIGAVVILLFWFWLTGFSGLLGAELDHAIERHASPDPAQPRPAGRETI